MSVTHAKVSAKSDPADTSLIRPSDWNADHVDDSGIVNVKDAPYNAVGDGVTNDTAAFQAAIDAVIAVGGGTVFVPDGTYALTGAQVSGTSNTIAYSGQIVFPVVEATAAPVAVRLLGVAPAPQAVWGPQGGVNQAPHQSGTILLSNATTGAIFDCKAASNAAKMSLVHVMFENMTVRLPNAPSASALRLTYAGALTMIGASVDVNIGGGDATAPSATAVAIDAPGNGNSAHVALKSTQVFGYGIGLRHNEHAVLDNFTAQCCLVGIAIGPGSSTVHASDYSRVLIQNCVTNIYCPPTGAYMHIFGSVTFEDAAGAPWVTVYDFDDVNSNLHGLIYYTAVNPGPPLLLNGATGIGLVDLTTATAPTALYAQVETPEFTASGAWGDLTTAGPAVTVNVPRSGRVKVTLTGIETGTAAGAYPSMGYAVSGANTIAPTLHQALVIGGVANMQVTCSGAWLLTGLTPGSCVFTVKYVAQGGVGNAYFQDSTILVETMP